MNGSRTTKYAANAAALLAAASVSAITVTISSPNDIGNQAAVTALTNACATASGNYYTLELEPGVYDLSGVKMSSGNHIVLPALFYGVLRGKGATPGDTILLGGGEADGCRVLSCSGRGAGYFTIENLTVTGGYSASSGGGISKSGGSVNCVDCVISNNVSGGFGGGADCVSFERCLVADNRALNGGGARLTNGGNAFAFNSTFRGNTAFKGGALYYADLVTNCVFEGNSATNGNGGGICREGTTRVIDSKFIGNYASGSGGGLSGSSSTYVTNCLFQVNRSGGHGVSVADGNYSRCTFVGHTGTVAIVYGGVFRNCRFEENRMAAINQGVFQARGGTLLFYNSLFVSNVASNNFLNTLFSKEDKGTLRLFNCTVVNSRLHTSGHSPCAANCVAVNTVFAGTTPQDISATAYPDMTNCLWVTQSGTLDTTKAVDCRKVSDIRFVDAAAGDWTPDWKSPARNAAWSDAAYLLNLGSVDLAGNPRVYIRDGQGVLDIGCLENQMKSKALRIMLR